MAQKGHTGTADGLLVLTSPPCCRRLPTYCRCISSKQYCEDGEVRACQFALRCYYANPGGAGCY